MEWGLKRSPFLLFNSAEIRDFLIRGTVRDPGIVYPNREWGYGKLNVYRSFTSFSKPELFVATRNRFTYDGV